MSTCTRWWHCLCRLTPSLATSPVISTRIGVDGALELLDDPHLLDVGQPAVQHSEGGRRAASAVAAARSRSQFSVATRSENNTTRVVASAPTPIDRRCSTSASSLAEPASCAAVGECAEPGKSSALVAVQLALA